MVEYRKCGRWRHRLAYDEQLNANVFLLLFTQNFCRLLSWIDVAGGEILRRMAWTEVLVGILVAPAAASRLPRHQPSSAHPTMLTRHVCQAYHAYHAYCAYTPGLLCLQTMPTLPTIPTVLTMPTHQAYHT